MTDAAAAVDTTGTDTATQPSTDTGQPANQPWYSTLDPDSQNWVAAKGWKKDNASEIIGPVINSYRNAEQLISKVKGEPDRIVVMPKDFNNQAEVSAYYEKIGVPKDIAGYGISPAEGETELDDMLKGFAETSLKAGAPKQAVEQQIKFYRDYVNQAMEQQEQSIKASMAEQQQEYIRESGPKLEENKAYIAQALQKFPELDEFAEIIERSPEGTKKFMKVLENMGRAMGEHRAVGVGSDPAGGGMSMEAAKQAIGQFNLDSTKVSALMNESHPGHSAAKAEFQRLHRMAAGMK
jgi:hypothetical protein